MSGTQIFAAASRGFGDFFVDPLDTRSDLRYGEPIEKEISCVEFWGFGVYTAF